MNNYSTISVPAEVKRVLERVKGERDWGQFLMDLYTEAENARRRMAFAELAGSLTGEELDAITASSEEFREGLRIG